MSDVRGRPSAPWRHRAADWPGTSAAPRPATGRDRARTVRAVRGAERRAQGACRDAETGQWAWAASNVSGGNLDLKDYTECSTTQKKTVDELLAKADDPNANSEHSAQALHFAEIKLQQEQIRLVSRANELSEKLLDSNNESRVIASNQLAASVRANSLAEQLLLSNKQASEQGEKNAKLMNDATEQLAKSTSSLKWATWALVAFTAVQAIIAFAALYISIHQSR